MAVADPRHPRASVGQPVLLGRGESCTRQVPQPGEDMRDGAGGWPCFLYPTHRSAPPRPSSGWMPMLRVGNKVGAKASGEQGWMWGEGGVGVRSALVL